MKKAIIQTGQLQSSPSQRRILASLADDSFMSQLPEGFLDTRNFPGYNIDPRTGIALKLHHVEAHTDQWGGAGRPKNDVAIFWLVKRSSHTRFILHVGYERLHMNEEDYVIFNANVMHSVYADKPWLGCAYQALPVKVTK